MFKSRLMLNFTIMNFYELKIYYKYKKIFIIKSFYKFVLKKSRYKPALIFYYFVILGLVKNL